MALTAAPPAALFAAPARASKIRKFDNGILTTVAGLGGEDFSGDGEAATAARLAQPNGIAVDAAGNLYVADTNNARIRKILASNNVITTIAGTGVAGYNGDNKAATSAQLYYPRGVTVDGANPPNIYITDMINSCIRWAGLASWPMAFSCPLLSRHFLSVCLQHSLRPPAHLGR